MLGGLGSDRCIVMPKILFLRYLYLKPGTNFTNRLTLSFVLDLSPKGDLSLFVKSAPVLIEVAILYLKSMLVEFSYLYDHLETSYEIVQRKTITMVVYVL